MLPRFTTYRLVYTLERNAESFGEALPEKHRLGPNNLNIQFGKNGRMITASCKGAMAGDHISGVFARRSPIKMSRVATHPVVAGMQCPKRVGALLATKQKGYLVGHGVMLATVISDAEFTVPIAVNASYPRPAFIRATAVNLSPKSLLGFFRKLGYRVDSHGAVLSRGGQGRAKSEHFGAARPLYRRAISNANWTDACSW